MLLHWKTHVLVLKARTQKHPQSLCLMYTVETSIYNTKDLIEILGITSFNVTVADVNRYPVRNDQDFLSIFEYAVLHKRHAVVSLMIHLADIDKTHGYALQQAALQRDTEMVKLLLSAGANVDLVLKKLRPETGTFILIIQEQLQLQQK